MGTLLAALKTITTNLIQVGSLKLHPLDLLLRMSPLAFIQCCFYSYMTGEMDDVVLFVNDKWDMNIASALFLNGNIQIIIIFMFYVGFIAFFLNVVSFTANKKTSALTMTVAANV